MQPNLLNNRYRIIRILGSGGFGETFLAEDTYMPSARKCVIKQLKPITNNPQVYELVKERFAREAAILEELGENNPQIPKLYAYFSEAGQFYLAQEWIEGDTLTNFLHKQGTVREDFARQLLTSILPVLSYIHSKGIVHRDIKPDNIILRHQDQKPVLIDFGAVKESMGTVVNSQGNTSSSIIIGTPGYMPSEQAAGRPVYASDLYALGLVIIYLLTGKTPQELQTDYHTGEIIWHEHLPQISPNFALVLDKAIQSHGRDRFVTAQAMLDALESNLTPQSPTVRISQPPLTLPNIKEYQETVQITHPPSIGSTVQNSNNNQNLIVTILITGGLISASVIFGFIITRTPQNKIEQKVQSPIINNTPVQPSSEPESNPESDTIMPDIHILGRSFYYLADSAFPNASRAQARVKILQTQGYSEAGNFWIPDYANLSGKPLFQVYAAKFPDRESCANFLNIYSQNYPEVYCFLGSSDPQANPDRFYSDFAWLSQIQISEAQLQGRNAWELDVMRNSIFARHGRKFKSQELQNYFDNQPWYNPKYNPDEFPEHLLSSLEKQNVAYILAYQERKNLRYIK